LRESAIDWLGGEFARRADVVLVVGALPGRAARCYVQPLDGAQPTPVTPEGIEQCDISPDGRLVAGSRGDPAADLMIYDAGGSPPTPVAGALKGDIPVRWAADGRSLYVRASGAVPARIYVVDLTTGRRQPWRSLAPRDPAGVFDVETPLVAADGQGYAYCFNRFLFDLYEVDGVR
jgi:hypothetical protein